MLREKNYMVRSSNYNAKNMNKIKIKQLEKWAKKIHNNALGKGFYDNELKAYFSHNQKLEIIKKLCEFHDAWKKDNEKYKEELADVVIQLLDYVYFKGIKIDGSSFTPELTEKQTYTMSKEIYFLIGYAKDEWYDPVIFRCFQIATYLNFDLIEEIEKKMKL